MSYANIPASSPRASRDPFRIRRMRLYTFSNVGSSSVANLHRTVVGIDGNLFFMFDLE